MPSGNTVKHGWILLCMCTPLYNETLRACFTVGYDKKFKNFSILIMWSTLCVISPVGLGKL